MNEILEDSGTTEPQAKVAEVQTPRNEREISHEMERKLTVHAIAQIIRIAVETIQPDTPNEAYLTSLATTDPLVRRVQLSELTRFAVSGNSEDINIPIDAVISILESMGFLRLEKYYEANNISVPDQTMQQHSDDPIFVLQDMGKFRKYIEAHGIEIGDSLRDSTNQVTEEENPFASMFE